MKKRSLLVRVAMISLIMAAVAMLLSGVVLYTMFRREALDDMKNRLNSGMYILDNKLGEYSCKCWLFDYWYEHGKEMDVPPYEKDDELFKQVMRQGTELDRQYNFRMMTAEEIEALTPDEQKIIAEKCYLDIFVHLSSCRQQLGIDRVECYRLNDAKDKACCYYIFTPDNAAGTIMETERVLGEELPFNYNEHPELKKLLEEGSSIKSDIETYKSATDGKEYACVYGNAGTGSNVVLALEQSMELIMHQLWMDVLQYELWIALVIAVAIAIILFTIYLSTLKPMVALQRDIREYAEDKSKEKLLERLALLNKRKDEIGSLSSDVNDMAGKIDEYYQEIIGLTAEKEHLEGELAMAANLKAHLMPNVFPAFPDVKSIDIYADQLTAVGVGGDFYDFFQVDEDHIAFTIADIFAGGKTSALFMIVYKVLINSMPKLGVPIEDTMRIINDKMCEANEYDLSLSAWFGIYEISTGRVEAVNAGHERAILIHDNKAEFLKAETESYLLGIFPDMNFNSFSFNLAEGDRLVLYTDGVTGKKEASQGDEAGYEVIKLLNKDENGRDSMGTVGLIQSDLFVRVGSDGFTEDATILCLERK